MRLCGALPTLQQAHFLVSLSPGLMIKVGMGLRCSETLWYQEPGSFPGFSLVAPKEWKQSRAQATAFQGNWNNNLFPLFSVKCIRSTPEYFAERLFKAMKVRSGV